MDIQELISDLKNPNCNIRLNSLNQLNNLLRNGRDFNNIPDDQKTVVIELLLKCLSDENKRVRELSDSILRTIINYAVPQLITSLRHQDPKIRIAVCWIVEETKIENEEIIKELINICINDGEAEICDAAKNAIIETGKLKESVIKILVEMLRNFNNNKVCETIKAILIGIGERSVNVLINELRSNNRNSMKYVIEILGELGNQKELKKHFQDAVEILIEKLLDQNVNVRDAAYNALEMIGKNIASSNKVLIYRATDSRTEIAEDAKKKLLRRGKNSVKDLTDLLDNRNDSIVRATIEVLGEIGRDAQDAIPKLIEKLDTYYEILVINTLGKVTPSTQNDVIEILTEKLLDQDVNVRNAVYNALEMIGKNIASSNKVLIYRATDNRPEISEKAKNELVRRGKNFINDLIEALNHKNNSVVKVAIEILGKIGKDAQDAIPKLIERLDFDKILVINTVGRITPPTRNNVIEILTEKLLDQDVNVREAAYNALKTIDENIISSNKVLIYLATDNRPEISEKAKNELVRRGKNSVNDLVEALNHKNNSVVKVAIEILGKLGKRLEEYFQVITEKLIEKLLNQDVNVRDAAYNALKMIDEIIASSNKVLIYRATDGRREINESTKNELINRGRNNFDSLLDDLIKTLKSNPNQFKGIFIEVLTKILLKINNGQQINNYTAEFTSLRERYHNEDDSTVGGCIRTVAKMVLTQEMLERFSRDPNYTDRLRENNPPPRNWT